MSRFGRSPSGPVHTWAPPQSPLTIEYSAGLLRELRAAGQKVDAAGRLYGIHHGETVRLIAIRPRAGLHPLGIFASRVRGKVFLTEEDLERFEKNQACVAFVIAGERAGFFVRDAAGSIETVRSHQEFSLPRTPREPALRWKQPWSWAFSLTLIPLLFLLPHHPPPPLAIALTEEDGQLRIQWSAPTSETLAILDSGMLTEISLKRDQSSVTYARRSGDVKVGIGAAQARFVGPPLPPGEVERARTAIKALQTRIAGLRVTMASGDTRIEALERRLQ